MTVLNVMCRLAGSAALLWVLAVFALVSSEFYSEREWWAGIVAWVFGVGAVLCVLVILWVAP